MKKSTIIFFGSSELSAAVLTKLNQEFDIALVVAPQNPTPVAEVAKNLELTLSKPLKLRDPDFYNQVASLNADLFVVVAYGKIIPQELLDLPKKGAINIHGSLLPKYRGASPIQSALANGDSKTGISIMLMDAQMDHGPVLTEAEVEIDKADNYVSLENKLSTLAVNEINQTISAYLTGSIFASEQDEALATYCKIITKEDGKINWTKSARDIYNLSRAYSKWPGIWTTFQGKNLKITACLPIDSNEKKAAGEVYQQEEKILVSTGNGALEILELQLEGKKNIKVKEFVNGRKNFLGAILN